MRCERGEVDLRGAQWPFRIILSPAKTAQSGNLLKGTHDCHNEEFYKAMLVDVCGILAYCGLARLTLNSTHSSRLASMS